MKKKILFVITKGNFGGAQKYVYDLATNYKANFEVAVACGDPGGLVKKLSDDGVETHELRFAKRDVNIATDLKAVRELINLYKKTCPDIIHLNSSKVGFTGSVAGRIYNLFYAPKDAKARIIFTAHGWAFNENRSPLSKLLFYVIHALTVILSDQTIAVSEKSLRDFSALPFVQNKITVIHNGINDIAHISKQNARNILHKDSPFQTWIGTVSELHNNKGLDIALEGIASVLTDNPTIGFYIAGTGSELESLQKQAEKLEIADQVIFLGFVADMRMYLKAFDIFTLSSRTECLPFVLLEAGLARTPVIATDVGGVSEIIENLKTGMLIKPLLPNEFKNAIKYALEHKKDISIFGDNLKTKVDRDFSFEKMVQRTKETYIH